MTGGAGGVARALTPMLIGEGYRVALIDVNAIGRRDGRGAWRRRHRAAVRSDRSVGADGDSGEGARGLRDARPPDQQPA